MCKRETLLAMTFKLGIEAQKTFRKLNRAELVMEVWKNVIFIDGELKAA
jgi:hypothetical protein